MKLPGAGSWTFENAEVAAAFDRHVREQLPWYDLATGIVAAVGRQFIPEAGQVVDVGASTGNIGRALAPTLIARKAELLALENAAEMAARYSGPGRLIEVDATEFDFAGSDLIVAFLVLMFVPVPKRRTFVERMIAGLRPGGALVVFDKLAPRGGEVGALSLRLTLAAKYEAGATADEIIAKELSLAGVQRPLDPAEVAGFEPIFRFGDFGGWLYPKGVGCADDRRSLQS
jgi:tRNA (cmo5U34)-methyltransferase